MIPFSFLLFVICECAKLNAYRLLLSSCGYISTLIWWSWWWWSWSISHSLPLFRTFWLLRFLFVHIRWSFHRMFQSYFPFLTALLFLFFLPFISSSWCGWWWWLHVITSSKRFCVVMSFLFLFFPSLSPVMICVPQTSVYVKWGVRKEERHTHDFWLPLKKDMKRWWWV